MTLYDQLSQLDSVRINFSAGGMHIINIVLAFVMFGVALNIRPRMFIDVLKNPKSVIIGLISQLVVLPLITFVLIWIFKSYLTPMIAMGMILVATCPGGNISNFISQLSRANTELSVSLTAITTGLSTFLTPANFALWGGLYVNFINQDAGSALRELHIDIFQMFETVFILLGIPLTLGILMAHYFPKFAEKFKKPMTYFSIAFFITMIVLSFSNNLNLFLKYIGPIFIIVLIHNLLALLSGYTMGTIFKLPKSDRRTITIETGIQNSGLGLVLLFNPKIFPPDLAIGGMLFITAWWGIWHIISGLTTAYIFHHHPLK